MVQKKLWILLFIVGFNASLCALPEFIGAQETAQGQSLTGASQLTDSLYSNPAASAFAQVYTVEGDFSFPQDFSVGILDTRTSQTGGALGYFRSYYKGYEQPIQGGKLALSTRLNNEWAIGATGKMLFGPNIAGVDTKVTDSDIGVMYNAANVQFGLAVRNLFGGQKLIEQQREWSFGVRLKWQDTVFLNAATTSDWEHFKPYQIGVGFEYVSPYYFALKAGYRVQPDNNLSYWSGGVSLITDKISFHYSVQFPNQNDESVTHVLGTSLMF